MRVCTCRRCSHKLPFAYQRTLQLTVALFPSSSDACTHFTAIPGGITDADSWLPRGQGAGIQRRHSNQQNQLIGARAKLPCLSLRNAWREVVEKAGHWRWWGEPPVALASEPETEGGTLDSASSGLPLAQEWFESEQSRTASPGLGCWRQPPVATSNATASKYFRPSETKVL